MFGMPASVSVDPVTHMQQFFADHDFERFWPGLVDAT
jgi:hypothetical protein